MTSDDRDRIDLAPEDRSFVQHVADIYRPPKTSAARRVAFGAALDERLARARRSRTRRTLAVATLAAAVAAIVLAVVDAFERREETPMIAGEEATLPAAPEARIDEVILAFTADEPDAEDEDPLPADYVAIESLLVGG